MKSIFKSKTVLSSFLTTVAGLAAVFSPAVGGFVAENAESLLVLIGGVNFVLRLVTKDKVVIFPED